VTKLKCLPIRKVKGLPESPGIYAFKKNGKFLYIGKAVLKAPAFTLSKKTANSSISEKLSTSKKE